MHINTSDPLKAHSAVGANGWQLETLSEDAPEGAVGLYRKGEQYAYLFKTGKGFELREVARCDFCGALAECRDYARQTNPQYGEWCKACFRRWRVEAVFQPMAYGGMLSTGWGDDA
jgi:hypothetical protein